MLKFRASFHCKLQAFVNQVYKRCHGGAVSKVAVISEMEQERQELGISVTDYVEFCRSSLLLQLVMPVGGLTISL